MGGTSNKKSTLSGASNEKVDNPWTRGLAWLLFTCSSLFYEVQLSYISDSKKAKSLVLIYRNYFFRPSEFFRPPKKVPKYMLNDYTQNGKIQLEETYLDGTRGKEK